MDNELYMEGVGISASVVETIVTLATSETPGVAGISSPSALSGIRGLLVSKRPHQAGVEVRVEETGLYVNLRLKVFYGYRLTEVAAAVRSSVADAILAQTGVEVSAVDIFIDGVVFAE